MQAELLEQPRERNKILFIIINLIVTTSNNIRQYLDITICICHIYDLLSINNLLYYSSFIHLLSIPTSIFCCLFNKFLYSSTYITSFSRVDRSLNNLSILDKYNVLYSRYLTVCRSLKHWYVMVCYHYLDIIGTVASVEKRDKLF